MSTQMRMRLFSALSSCLFAPGANFKANTPLIFQTLLQELFSLLATLSLRPDTTHATRHVRELISGVLQGSCGDLDGSAVEKEYGVPFRNSDAQRIRDCAAELALAMCVENDSPSNRQYILRYLMAVRLLCHVYFDDTDEVKLCFVELGILARHIRFASNVLEANALVPSSLTLPIAFSVTALSSTTTF